jgi:hypothetical protein
VAVACWGDGLLEAQSLKENPQLLRLRELQALEKMAESGGRCVVGLGGETLLGILRDSD